VNLNIRSDVLLKNYSTFKIGGFAKSFVEVCTIEQMKSVFSHIRKYKIPYLVLGKGSNILFDDKGFNGLVILNKIDFLEQNNNIFHVGSGYSISSLAIKTAKDNLSGLEFASSIPATVGGAVYMNASLPGYEIKNCLKEVLFLSENGKEISFNIDELEFDYRYSTFQTMKGVILSCKFELKHLPDAYLLCQDLLEKRRHTQPITKPSAGCVFCNPKKNISAGYLIDMCGLKGKAIGGAKISEHHANFIINEDNASSMDVLLLIEDIKKTVQEKTDYNLKIEIKYIPYD